jgi:hypothetical protein
MIELIQQHWELCLAVLSFPLMGFIFGSSKSSTTQHFHDNRVANTATDEAQLAMDQGQIINPYGIGISGTTGTTLNFQDTEVVTKALDNITALALGFQEGLGDYVGQATKAISANTADALGYVTGLSESRLTDGDSSRNRIILYVVLAVLAVFGLIFWRRK